MDKILKGAGMKKKIANFIRSKRHKIKESLKWHKDYFILKHRIGFNRSMRIISFVLKTSILMTSFFAILWFAKIILASNSGALEFNTAFSTEYISKSGLLSAQITLTLICVSLIALVSNIEKKYIYGESLLDLAFPSKILSFKFAMIVLFGLLLFNSFLMLRQVAFEYVIVVFLITLYTAIIVLYRFASVFLSQRSFKNRLFYKYYKCNLAHMKKTKPIEPQISEPMRKLKVMTLRSISKKDYITLNENMMLYFNLLKPTLFNHPKVVEEYYTEHLNYQDLVGHIKEISLELLYNREPTYGLKVYNALLRHLNFYNIVCVQEIAFTSHYFIEAFPDISDKTQIKNYLSGLLQMSKMIIHQSYLYSIADLSYCRLAKPENMIYYFAQSKMYERIYDLITQSTKLSTSDKEELIESMRSSIIDVTIGYLYADIEDFKKKQRFHKEHRKHSLEIKGEPIALLFIKFFENCDCDSLNNYHSVCGIHKDKKDFSATFALVLSMLSVINSLYLKGKREYLYDVQIDSKTAKTVFAKCKLLTVTINDELLDSFYEFIISHYVATETKSTPEGGLYSFHPKFNYKKEVVDTFFAYFYHKNQPQRNLEDICLEKGLSHKKGIDTIISNLTAFDEDKKDSKSSNVKASASRSTNENHKSDVRQPKREKKSKKNN